MIDQTERTQALLAIEHALTDAQRVLFVGRFPRLRGAKVADILDILDDSDAYCDKIDDLASHHPEWDRLHSLAYLALVACAPSPSWGPTWDETHALANAARTHLP